MNIFSILRRNKKSVEMKNVHVKYFEFDNRIIFGFYEYKQLGETFAIFPSQKRL